MTEQEVIHRIKQLCDARSWTIYRLAKESGITYSTLSTLINKENMPSISTLSKLCDGFGISLSQFFDKDDVRALLSADDQHHLEKWNRLSGENKRNLERFIDYLLSQQ